MQSEDIEKAKEFYKEGREERALFILKKVLEREPNSKEALQLKAEIFYIRNKQKKALQIYQTLLSLYEAQEDLKGEIEILSEIGNIQYNLDHFEEARETFKYVLSKFDDLDQPLGDYLSEQMVFRLNDLASVERDKGDLDASLETRKCLLRIHENMGSQVGMVEDLDNMASIYHEMGKEQKAKENYQRALEICQEEQDVYLEPLLHYELGRILSGLGEDETAAEHLTRIIEYYEDLELTNPLFNLEDFEEFNQAERLLTKTTRNILKKIDKLIQQNEINPAKILCKKLTPTVQKYNSNSVQSTFNYYRSVIAFKEHNYEDAKEHLQRSIRALKRQEGYREMELHSKIKSLLGEIRAKTR